MATAAAMASSRKAARMTSATASVLAVTNGTTAFGAAMFVVVIPVMVIPITAKNRHIRPVIIKITRRIIRPVVTRTHDSDASGQGHQQRPAEQEPEPPD